MKLFWSFMIVLFAGSMAVLAMPERSESVAVEAEQSSAATQTRTTERGNASSEQRVPDTIESVAEQVAEQRGDASTGLTNEAAGEMDAPVETAEADPAEAVESAQIEIAVEDVSAFKESEVAQGGDPFAAAAKAYLGLDETEEPVQGEQEQAVAQVTEGVDAAPDDAEAVAANTEQAAVPEAAPTRVAVNEDGSLLIDGRITIPGAGTAERPYVLDWPVLTSVGREYKPEKGMDELPEWLKALEGKRVRLTGHIVLPLVAKATDELLLTMNPWDGCCVGVPPTPYDALEVALSESVSMSGASMYGAMEGTFRVDPYIIDGWLLGLYLLEEAEVKG